MIKNDFGNMSESGKFKFENTISEYLKWIVGYGFIRLPTKFYIKKIVFIFHVAIETEYLIHFVRKLILKLYFSSFKHFKKISAPYIMKINKDILFDFRA